MQTLHWMSTVLMALLSLAAITQAEVTCCEPDQALIDAFLDQHNELRRQVGVDDLVWDASLAEGARQWSSNCQFKHNPSRYGENLAASWPYMKDCPSVANQHSSMWAGEIANVDQDGSWACIMDFSENTCGHYSQMVWANTRRVGCATCSCDNLPNYTVCRYDPPGNYWGQKPY